MSILYFVRHAHAEWKPDENRPLSARGRQDAVRVADVLRPLRITAIYSSPARRARQTVEPLAVRLDLPLHMMPDLRERELGDVAAEDFLEAVEAAWTDPWSAHPGGEPNAAAQQRGIAVVHALRKPHRTEHIVLSTHGALLALILQHSDSSVDLAFWTSLTMPDIYSLSVRADGKVAIRRLWRTLI